MSTYLDDFKHSFKQAIPHLAATERHTKSGFTTPFIVIASGAKQSQKLGDCFAPLAMTDYCY